MFIALAVIGFLIWQIRPSGVLLGWIGMDYTHPAHFYLYTIIEPSIRSVLALAAGFLFPRGFYLWGLAIAIHTPLTHVLTANQMSEAGIEPYMGGTAGMLNYLLIDSMLTVAIIVTYTCCAGVGALASYLVGRSRGTD